MSYLAKAIKSLHPEAEFVFTEDDYSTINWIILNGEAPNKKQIDDEIKKIQLSEAKAEANKASAKVSAQAKLAALGLTADEVVAIVGN